MMIIRATKVGTFRMGSRNIDLFTDPTGDGGAFSLNPPNNSNAQVFIGLDNTWTDVVGVLLHELLELALTDVGARYTSAPDYAQDQAGYLFVVNHTNQFSDAVNRVAQVVAKALPELSDIYTEQEAKRKKKLRRKK